MKAGSEHKPEVHPQQHHTCSVSLPKGKKKIIPAKNYLKMNSLQGKNIFKSQKPTF